MWIIGWCLCNNAAATTSWASVILDCLLERASSGDWFRRDTKLARGKQQPAQCWNTTQDSLQYGKEVSALLHRRACTGAYAFFVVSVACINVDVLSTSVCAGVYITQVFWHLRTHLLTHSLQGVHMPLHTWYSTWAQGSRRDTWRAWRIQTD